MLAKAFIISQSLVGFAGLKTGAGCHVHALLFVREVSRNLRPASWESGFAADR